MILIIGAGLSGLLAAYRLEKQGIPFRILESRSRVGGRINTLYGSDDTPIEMGATWFWGENRNLISLLKELGLNYFEQFNKNTVFFQQFASSPALSVQIPSQPPSYRIYGGTSNLINTLYQKIDRNHVLLNQSVNGINFSKNSVQVITKDSTFEGDKVVLCIPPKLWAKKILFEPPLPNNLLKIAGETHTWMEDSIKVGLVYSEPFWQLENLSGTLYSNAGPITELYDHCNEERSKFALCGFINSSLKNLDYAERRNRVIDQLKNVYGAKAEGYIDYEDCVWSKEINTFEDSDLPLYPHQNLLNIFHHSGPLIIPAFSNGAKNF